MPVAYEELANSPSYEMDREGGSGQRIVRVAWSDIGAAILEVFPGALFGYPYTASMPGFPWLRAEKMKIEAFDPDAMYGVDEPVNIYSTGARVTVDYAPYKWPDPEQDDGPGQPDDVTFLEQRLTFGGEYLTLPGTGVRWNTDVNGTAYSVGAADKPFQVFEDINVGVIIPTIEHDLTWHYVSLPPWTGIRNCIGKVNADTHMNCPPGTLLLTGCTATRTYSLAGSPTWELQYRISEKCMNYPVTPNRGLNNPLITAAGTGYKVGDILQFVGGNGAPARVKVTSVNATTGGITGVSVVSAGNYTTPPPAPNAVVGSPTGSGAQISDSFSRVVPVEAQGWNFFFRPQTGKFEKLVRKDGTGIYQSAAFSQLYNGG